MNQFSQFDVSDPFSQPPPAQPLTSASDALSLPPLAAYPSREALFEAIQSWAKLQGYAFATIRSKQIKGKRQKVYYACDRHPLPEARPRIERVRETQSRGSGCLFQVVAVETFSLGWEVRYCPEARFNIYNYPPSQSPAAYPLHYRLLVEAQNITWSLFSAGKSRVIIRVIN